MKLFFGASAWIACITICWSTDWSTSVVGGLVGLGIAFMVAVCCLEEPLSGGGAPSWMATCFATSVAVGGMLAGFVAAVDGHWGALMFSTALLAHMAAASSEQRTFRGASPNWLVRVWGYCMLIFAALLVIAAIGGKSWSAAAFALVVFVYGQSLVIEQAQASATIRVLNVLRQYEVGSTDDLKAKSGLSFDEVIGALTSLMAAGKVERIELQQNNALYRCTEKRKYARGLIKHELTLD